MIQAKQAKIKDASKAEFKQRKTRSSVEDQIYNVVGEFTENGVKKVILQHPTDTSDLVMIIAEFVEFVEEVIETVKKGKGIFARFAAWVKGLFS